MNNANDRRGRGDDDRIKELSFEEEDNQPAKAGDPRVQPGRSDPEISPQRAREAGMTGAAANRNITDDDLSPETLLDEQDALDPTDQQVRVVKGDEIGGGTGLDEAELAEVDPVRDNGSDRK